MMTTPSRVPIAPPGPECPHSINVSYAAMNRLGDICRSKKKIRTALAHILACPYCQWLRDTIAKEDSEETGSRAFDTKDPRVFNGSTPGHPQPSPR